MFRLRAVGVVNGLVATTISRRFVKATDPTYEDDRWLEAEFQDVEKTVEERYAFEKQRDVLKKLVVKMREENDAKLNQVRAEQAEQRKEAVLKINKSIEELRSKLEKVTKARSE